jgi:hypothetical protein
VPLANCGSRPFASQRYLSRYAWTTGFSPGGSGSSTDGSSVPTNWAKKRRSERSWWDHDRADRVGLLVRLEVEQGVGHRSPHAHGLVRFAGIGGKDVLKDRLGGLRHVGVEDGSEVVVHG